MSGKLRLIILLFMVLVGVCGDSEGEDKPCPDPDDPNMLQHPNTTIEGKVGDRVILPCSTKDKTDISHDEVEWLVKDPTTGKKFVHLYFHGEDFLHNQRDDFKDRTSLFKKELSSGNCSLSLLVNTSHSGTYRCCVGGILCCTLNLKVLPKGKDDPSQKHQDVPESPDKPNNDTDGPNNIIGGVLGVAALIIIIIIIISLAHCYREQLKNFCPQRRKPKNRHGVPDEAQRPTQDEEKKPLDQNPNEEQNPLNVVVDQDN